MKLVLTLTTLVWISLVYFGPFDSVQGISSKLLYVHVPSVWIAYLGYFLTFVFSISYLVSKNSKFDSLAVANAKSGVIFTAITLISGSVWGKFTWGTWWVWGDARLNLTAILMLVYLGYIASRQFNFDLSKTARNSSIIGIFGIIQIPILHFSVLWWRSVHQQATLLSQETVSSGDAPMSTDILITLLSGVAIVSVLHFLVVKILKNNNDKVWDNYLKPQSRAKIL